jgi:hypothetical protein
MSCHYQHFPTLNRFGRNFKDQGYTLMGSTQPLIEAEDLSIPQIITPGIEVEIEAKKTYPLNPATTFSEEDMDAKGSLHFPSKVAISLGGRAAKQVGYFFKMSLMDNDAHQRFSAFRMPIGLDVGNTHLQIVPFTSDTEGVGFGYETLATGILRSPLLNDNATAFGYLGLSNGPAAYSDPSSNFASTWGPSSATGLAFVASQQRFFINYTPWKNQHATGDVAPLSLTQPLHYLRAAVTPQLGEWDLAVGCVLLRGKERHFDGLSDGTPISPNLVATAVNGIDAQAQGIIKGHPLGIYSSFASTADSGEHTNIYHAGSTGRKAAFALSAEFGLLPERLILGGGFRLGKNGVDDTKDHLLNGEIGFYPWQNFQLLLNGQMAFQASRSSAITLRTKVLF